MAETKAILEYLGIDANKIKTIDDFKQLFEADFIRTSAISERKDLYEPMLNSAIGKRLGSMETEFKRMAKEYGVDLTEDELKEKKVEDIAKTVLKKAFSLSDSLNTELKEKINATGDNAIKEWQAKLEKSEKKFSDTKALLDKTAHDFESFKSDSDNRFKSFQVSHLKNDALSKIKFKAGISDIEREGFNAIIDKNYQLDFDETEKLIVRSKDGKRIPHSSVAGKFKSYDEILEEEAIKAKLFEIKKTNTPVTSFKLGAVQSNPTEPQQNKRQAHVSLR